MVSKREENRGHITHRQSTSNDSRNAKVPGKRKKGEASASAAAPAPEASSSTSATSTRTSSTPPPPSPTDQVITGFGQLNFTSRNNTSYPPRPSSAGSFSSVGSQSTVSNTTAAESIFTRASSVSPGPPPIPAWQRQVWIQIPMFCYNDKWYIMEVRHGDRGTHGDRGECGSCYLVELLEEGSRPSRWVRVMTGGARRSLGGWRTLGQVHNQIQDAVDYYGGTIIMGRWV